MCDEGGDVVVERKGEFHGALDDVDVILHYRDGPFFSIRIILFKSRGC